MSIIGKNITLSTTGTLPPYTKYTFNTSNGQLSGISFVGYTILPPYSLGGRQVGGLMISTYDFSNSPNLKTICDYGFCMFSTSGRTGVSVSFPNSIEYIGDYGIASVILSGSGNPLGNLNVTSLPNNLQHLGAYGMAGQRNSTLSTLPNNLSYIGDYAFKNCKNITLSALPASVAFLGEGAFNYCTAIISMDLSATSLTIIPRYCF